MISQLSKAGLRSEHAYAIGFASIALSILSWAVSKAKPSDTKAQADRWGIFVGEWAPTWIAIGIALRQEELASGMQ